MKKIFFAVLIILLLSAAGAGYFVWQKNKKPEPMPEDKTGLQIISPKSGETISSPLRITGVINGNGWTGFEGQVGTVRLFNLNGQELASGYLPATTDWMALPTSFEAVLNFQSDAEQPGTLVFHNENASGLPEKNREFVLPVKIQKTSPENMLIRVYFNNNKMDPEFSCNKVFAVERSIAKIEAVGSAALWQLLMGPTEEEKEAGFFTSINPGVKLQGLEITKDGTAIADFDEQLQAGVGGSCKVSAIRAEITQTLKQFPTVKNVIISINGKTEDILQP